MQSNNGSERYEYAQLKPPVLDRRLSMIYSLVPEGCIPADVGTDHAYLPCSLIMTGRVGYCIASDVAQGPFGNAVRTIRNYGLENRISCFLSDGTKSLPAEKYDTLIIAGMGGELIRDILEQTEALRRKYLVLQPMTHDEDLRRFLSENGFSVGNELAVLENNKVYIAYTASYHDGAERSEDGFFLYYGGYAGHTDEASERYVRKQTARLLSRLNGLKNSSSDCRDEIDRIQKILNDDRLERFL